MKKFFAILMSLVLMLSLAVPAMADDVTSPAPGPYKITIDNDATGHIYEAYQIFKGDLQVKGTDNVAGNQTTSVLSNIEWGASVANAAALGNATAYAENLANGTKTVENLLDEIVLGDAVKNSGETSNPYVIDGLDAGYYLIKDQDGSLNGTNDSYTKFILEVLEDSTVTPKSAKPSVQKKVDDINDSNNTEDAENWQDSADYDIGDSVPFQLKATLASNVSAYDTYKIVFHDTMSKGLTFEEITKVTIGGNEITSGYNVYTKVNTDGTTYLVISFDNIKAQGAKDGNVVIIEYTAELNENAEIGALGNPNYVYLEYSNNPNWEGFPDNYEDGDNDNDGIPNDKDDDDDNDGKKDTEDDDDDGDGSNDNEDNDDDNDGTPDDEEEPTGKTPEDKVIVFTYKVAVDKVHQTGGTVENPIYSALPGAGFTLYKWEVVTPATETSDAVYNWVAIGDTLTGDAMTTFEWKGLDDGEYKLEETITPPGYNTIAPIEFTITAEHKLIWESEERTEILTKLEAGNLVTGEVDAAGNETEPNFAEEGKDGIITTDIVNRSGTTLPETGGMGTTIFYAVGGVMVAAAAILLVTKKRMSNNA